jgi:hypothetical protein
VEEGWRGRSIVAGACAAAGTPFSGQTPVNSYSGRVRSARGCTVETGIGFIVAGVGLTQRVAARVGLSTGACSGVVLIYPSSCACRSPKRVNLAICLV